MSARIPVTSLLLFVLSISLSILISPAQAKNKKKQTLPDIVLNAQRVYVVIRPEAGEPVTNPRANRIAQDEVERALSKWHRFDLVMESTTADLVIAVSKGHSGGPIITNMPDDRPVVFQSGGVPGAGVRLGGRQGQPPDLTAAGSGNGQPNRGPQLGSQLGRQKIPLKFTWAAWTIRWMRRRSGDIPPRILWTDLQLSRSSSSGKRLRNQRSSGRSHEKRF